MIPALVDAGTVEDGFGTWMYRDLGDDACEKDIEVVDL